jgi:hypothetical protein
MDARTVERSGERLRTLKAQSIDGLLLAPAAFAAALVATRLAPSFAFPVFVGACVVASRGMLAYVRRQLLVEELALDPHAQALDEVRRFALRAASPARRAELAQSIRRMLQASEGRAACVEANRTQLEELAAALEDEELELEPAEAVKLNRMAAEGWPQLYDTCSTPAEASDRLSHILNGFHRARLS